jgi:hypothetical protein
MRIAPPLFCLTLLLCPVGLAGQGICRPAADSHEAQMLAAYSVPIAYAYAGAGPLSPGAARLTLEGTYLPDIDEDLRTATFCRPGKGPEHTDFLFAYPRPRAQLGLPDGFRVEASWIPPVRLNHVKSNLVGLSLERGVPLGSRGAELDLRAHATFGVVRAPITCDDAELADPTSECFQGTRSDDHYHPNIFGLEALYGWSLGEGRVRPFIGAGVNVIHPRFQANFINSGGSLEVTRIVVNMTRGVMLAGATWVPSHGLGLTGEIYAIPGDAVTGRVALSYAMRR